MKIATWNVNSIRTRLSHVESWLDLHTPDVLAIQETKVVDDDFPIAPFSELGYSAFISGQKSYNGVAVLTKLGAEDISTSYSGYDQNQKRYIALTINGTRIINVYVPNGSEIGSDKYEYKLNWLCNFSQYLVSELNSHQNLVVMGDFNIAPENLDVFDPEFCSGQILCSEAERFALKEVMGSDLVDIFRYINPESNTFSWWDYRRGAFRRNQGMRIDHILATKELADSCKYCTIDREPRMLEKPSDHAPVIAHFGD